MTAKLLFFPALALLLSGCMRLELNVKVNEDGSAVVTEKLAFSEALRDLASASPKEGAILDKALSKEGALERMARMGEGIQLVSHSVGNETVSGASFKQATTVYKIPDINKLRIVPPFPNVRDPDTYLAFVLEPCFARKGKKDSPGGIDLPGWMALEYHLVTAKAAKQPPEDPPALTPAQAEELRALLPATQDLLRTFSAKVTLEGYDKLMAGYWLLALHSVRDRDCTHGVSVTEILNISGENSDSFDHPILADEASLLELIQGNWTGPNFGKMLYENWHEGYKFLNNSRIPLVYANGNRGRCLILPSEHFYQRYFVGKAYDDALAPPRSRLQR